jgi:hypothetical protein
MVSKLTKIDHFVKTYPEHPSNISTHLKFKCSINDDQFEELIAYNDLMTSIEKITTIRSLWQFK